MSGAFSKQEKKRTIESFRRFKAGECLDDLGLLHDKLNSLAASREKCCDKNGNCLKSNFNLTKSFLPGAKEFDYLEAKICFEHYLKQYQFMSIEEWDIWIYDKFLSTCFGLDKGGKIIHSYRLNYGTAQEPKSVNVCRDIWRLFLNVSDWELRNLSKAYKNNYSALGSAIGERQLYGDATDHHANIDEIKEFCKECKIEPEPLLLKMGVVSRTQLHTFLWFRDHFELAGDPQPNGDQIHLDKIELSDLYILYVQEVQENCLTYSSWCKFWKKVFPEVTVRKWKNVSGKCEDCALINNGRLVAKSQEEIRAFRKLHLLHKSGNFMLERLGYRTRRERAKGDPKTILSIIIDTMDNSHCYVPYFAHNDQLTSPLHQGILGCLNHGENKFTVYRTTGKSTYLYGL